MNFNERREEINAEREPTRQAIKSIGGALNPLLTTSSTMLAIITGIDKRKENFNAFVRERPERTPVQIVVPLLVIPGRTVNPWLMPIISACLYEIASKFGVFKLCG